MTASPTQSDELVERLNSFWLESGYETLRNPDGPEAATRIKALQTEIARLRGALERITPMQTDKNSAANRDCLAKAKPGEPVFIILGRDPDGANIVRLWAERRKAAGDPAHAEPVFAIADAMAAWASDPANAPQSAPPKSAYPPIEDHPHD